MEVSENVRAGFRCLVAILVMFVTFTANSSAQQRQTIRVFAPVHTSMKAELEQFLMDTVPGVDVEVDVGTVAPPELLARIKGETYDVIVMTVGAESLVSAGLLMELDAFVTHSGMHTTLFDSMRIAGRLYDLPVYLDPFVVIYNRGIFDRHNLRHPVAGWSWDEFVAAAIHTSDPHAPEPVYGAVLPMNRLWPTIAWQSGNELVLVDSQTLSFSLNIAERLINGEALVGNGNIVSRAFSHDAIAMQITTLETALTAHYTYGLGDLEIDWGVVPLPDLSEFEGINQVVGFTTVGIVSSTRHRDSAWQVARALAEKGAGILGSSLQPSAYLTQSSLEEWPTEILPAEMEATIEELRNLFRRRHVVFGRGNVEANQLMFREMRDQLRYVGDGNISGDQALQRVNSVRVEVDW